MEPSVSEIIGAFLEETRQLCQSVDALPAETAGELYAMLNEASAAATGNIQAVDPALRVELCDRLDRVTDRLAETAPPRRREGANIFTPAVHDYRRWGNVELMKDKGLAGYMLAKETGAHAVMFFGAAGQAYPYADMLEGLELLCTDAAPGEAEVYYEHLQAHYREMDVLVLHGMYQQTAEYLDAYRRLRPDGSVFCGLDMNSYWMGNINWDAPIVKRFAAQCNVVATSCRPLRDVLNRNPSVPFSCRWLPNGFYDSTGEKVVADADVKENVILTVGRIGTAQKNNEEMLLGFALASGRLPGWQLRLVGTVDESFKPFIKEFFEKFPDLEKRVVFTGPIAGKAALYGEYARAKIFALTSQMEGGTPNVYAEALVHGCMFVTSDIDAAEDITDCGALGEIYPLQDVNALAAALVRTAKRGTPEKLRGHIEKATAYARKYYDWTRNAAKLAHMLDAAGPAL